MTDLSNRDGTLYDLAKQYQASKVRSANENDIRADIRANVDKLGLDPLAFQAALRMAEDMTTGERQDYTTSLNEMLTLLDGRESDLFGEEEMRKRDERKRKAEEKRAKAAQPESTDDNPRSDPKSGGAGGADGKGKAKDGKPKKPGNKLSGRERPTEEELTAAAAAAPGAHADEQEEGGALLDGAVDKMKENAAAGGAPISQSAQAAAIREELGLP